MSDCCSSDSSTARDIRALCDACDQPACPNVMKPTCYPAKYDPGVSYFTSMITPVTNLVPVYSGTTGSVQFKMRRKNKTVTLQWEPFTGIMAASGVAYLSVQQAISNLPQYPISIPIYITYKSVGRITHIMISPASHINILFYLNTNGSPDDITVGDVFSIPGGCVTWIVE